MFISEKMETLITTYRIMEYSRIIDSFIEFMTTKLNSLIEKINFLNSFGTQTYVRSQDAQSIILRTLPFHPLLLPWPPLFVSLSHFLCLSVALSFFHSTPKRFQSRHSATNTNTCRFSFELKNNAFFL